LEPLRGRSKLELICSAALNGLLAKNRQILIVAMIPTTFKTMGGSVNYMSAAGLDDLLNSSADSAPVSHRSNNNNNKNPSAVDEKEIEESYSDEEFESANDTPAGKIIYPPADAQLTPAATANTIINGNNNKINSINNNRKQSYTSYSSSSSNQISPRYSEEEFKEEFSYKPTRPVQPAKPFQFTKINKPKPKQTILSAPVVEIAKQTTNVNENSELSLLRSLGIAESNVIDPTQPSAENGLFELLNFKQAAENDINSINDFNAANPMEAASNASETSSLIQLLIKQVLQSNAPIAEDRNINRAGQLQRDLNANQLPLDYLLHNIDSEYDNLTQYLQTFNQYSLNSNSSLTQSRVDSNWHSLLRIWLSDICSDLLNDAVIEKQIKRQLITKFKQTFAKRSQQAEEEDN
jgi:hypothetical protein